MLAELNQFFESFRMGGRGLIDRRRLCDTQSEEYQTLFEDSKYLFMYHGVMARKYVKFGMVREVSSAVPNVPFETAVADARARVAAAGYTVDDLINYYNTTYSGYVVPNMDRVEQLREAFGLGVLTLAAYGEVRALNVRAVYQDVLSRVSVECEHIWAREFMRTFNKEMNEGR